MSIIDIEKAGSSVDIGDMIYLKVKTTSLKDSKVNEGYTRRTEC